MKNRVHHTTWDVDDFMAHLGTASTGERHAMLFIANVWNPGYAKKEGWIFDIIAASQEWDRQHHLAFLAWAMKPEWP
jgi:hypothetical protein